MDPLENDNRVNESGEGNAPKPTQPEKVSDDTLERISDEPGSLGVDIDGTNPASKSHHAENNDSGPL
jgi:hypothetical protein